MPILLNLISAHQLESLPKDKTVFFFPVGPFEDHGPHLPLSLDMDEAVHLSQQLSLRLEKEMRGWVGVVMPPVPLGIEGNTSKIALTVRAHVLRDWLVDCSRGLNKMGFRYFVGVSGHLGPRQLTALEEVGKILRRDYAWWRISRWSRRFDGQAPIFVSASSAWVTPTDVWKSPFMPDPMEHGGRRDTSVGLALYGSKVGTVYQSIVKKDRPKRRWQRWWKRRIRQSSGYWGEPQLATSEQGREILSNQMDEIFSKLRAVLEGSSPQFLFRSWYSVLPPNQSLFKAWALSAILVMIWTLWILTYGIPSSMD